MLRTAALFIAVALPYSWAATAEDPKILPNFQIVNDNVLRGGQPSDEGISRLAQRGVKTVIDLRLASEHSIPNEKQLVESNGMHFVSVPMKGMAAPTDEQLFSVLRILNDSKQWPVFVHCRRGADRTGTAIAAYRIAHGWDNKQALHEAKSFGMSMFARGMQHYVADYKPVVIPVVTLAAGGADPAAPLVDTRGVR